MRLTLFSLTALVASMLANLDSDNSRTGNRDGWNYDCSVNNITYKNIWRLKRVHRYVEELNCTVLKQTWKLVTSAWAS